MKLATIVNAANVKMSETCLAAIEARPELQTTTNYVGKGENTSAYVLGNTFPRNISQQNVPVTRTI